MTVSEAVPARITLVVAHGGTLSGGAAKNLVDGADEIIEVGSADGACLGRNVRNGVKFRHMEPRLPGLAHALNLATSFASSEWIIFCFGDERVRSGWIEAARVPLSVPDAPCIHLFQSDGGSEIPIVAVRRAAFVYGPFDESFASGRLAVLHWVARIFPRQARRLLPNEGVASFDLPAIEGGTSQPVASPLIALVELWHDLQLSHRRALLEQAISEPTSVMSSLHELLNAQVQLALPRTSAYRSGRLYDAKRFWETNSTGYIRWEVYQPDEPEILSLVERIAPSSVLELGCGAGRNTRYFSGLARYAGIDLSMNLLGRAAERQEPNSIGTVCGDITALPISSGAFDLVFADSTVQHVTPSKICECAAEMLRVASRYVCLIEYTEEESAAGDWFEQIHMFAHDYRALFEPYCDLIWHADTTLRVHPARKELFLFRKR